MKQPITNPNIIAKYLGDDFEEYRNAGTFTRLFQLTLTHRIRSIERRCVEVERKVDLILEHLGLEYTEHPPKETLEVKPKTTDK